MGLILLVVVGALLGWLASIVLRRERRAAILALAGAGVVGALLSGFVFGGANLLAAVGARELALAVVGSLLAIAVVDLARERAFR